MERADVKRLVLLRSQFALCHALPAFCCTARKFGFECCIPNVTDGGRDTDIRDTDTYEALFDGASCIRDFKQDLLRVSEGKRRSRSKSFVYCVFPMCKNNIAKPFVRVAS